ncbi:MAG: histidine--tRNA ligase [Bacilli bacterium]
MNNVTPKILSGFMELLPEDQILFNTILDTIRNNFESFAYLPLDTPIIEYSSVLLAKAGGETEKQIYRFNKGDNDLSLRFDLTVPLSRYVAMHKEELTFPFKRYQIGKSFRGERPQKGRYREFYQCDIDVIGRSELSVRYDAEIPSIIYNIFKSLNIGKFTIRINNRKILLGYLESLNLKDISSDILRIIDKIDKIGIDKVKEEMNNLSIDKDKQESIISFIKDYTQEEVISYLKSFNINNDMYIEGVNELNTVLEFMKSYNILKEYYKVDLTIVRGLDYYTSTVYETVLDDYLSLGSICSGGRYNDLTALYTNEVLPGVGISIGLTRLFSVLKDNNIISSSRKSVADILLVSIDNNNYDYILSLSNTLRSNNIKTDIYYEDKGMKQKMRYADKLSIPYVIVIGEDEVNSKTVTLKNMILGTQDNLTIEEVLEKFKKR